MKQVQVRPLVYAVLAEMGRATITQVHEKLPQFKRSQVESCMWCGANEGRLGTVAQKHVNGKAAPSLYWLLDQNVPEPVVIEEDESDDGETEGLFSPNRRYERRGPMYPSVWAWGSREPISRAVAA